MWKEVPAGVPAGVPWAWRGHPQRDGAESTREGAEKFYRKSWLVCQWADTKAGTLVLERAALET